MAKKADREQNIYNRLIPIRHIVDIVAQPLYIPCARYAKTHKLEFQKSIVDKSENPPFIRSSVAV